MQKECKKHSLENGATDPFRKLVCPLQGPSGVASQECPTTSKAEIDDEEDEESEEEEEEEEDEEDEEDEEEEDEATDSEEEEDLEQMKEGQGDDEEEEEEAEEDGDKSPMSPRPVSTEKKLEPHKGNSGSSEEQQNKRLTESPSSPAEEPPAPSSVVAERQEHLEELPLEEESPMSQLFELEIEALPLDTTPSKKSEDLLTTVLENGAAMVTSTSFNGGVSPHTWGDSSPPRKKSRKEKQTEAGPLGMR